MNMILHGIETPNVVHANTLADNISDIQDRDRYEVILANPPFGGKERKEVQQNFPIKTGETAFLFLQHFIKTLRAGGRAAIVIKNTFLSNTHNASTSIRKLLLAEMQKVIEAEKSELFDVLAYVAFATPPVTREDRAVLARSATAKDFSDKHRAFIDFVLGQYVKQGVDELDPEKFAALVKLKYNAISDAFDDLGKPEQVRSVFVGFQKHPYAYRAAAGS